MRKNIKAYENILRSEAEACLARLFECTGCETQSELAAALDTTQSCVAAAQKRGSIPAEWLISLLWSHAVNPLWVLTGNEPQLLLGLNPNKNALAQYPTESLMAEVLRRAIQNLR